MIRTCFCCFLLWTVPLAGAAADAEPPIRAWVNAIAPPSSKDRATLRIRCKDRHERCRARLDCTSGADGSRFQGWVREAIPARGSVSLEAQEIADITGDWSGKGRLACAIRSDRRIGAQVWTRSQGRLINNSALEKSRRLPRNAGHIAGIHSILAPEQADQSNIRIRCADEKNCTRTRLACNEDDGTLHEASLGTIAAAHVRHLQSDELADLIGHRWEGMGLSCELHSDNPFTVQVLTRTRTGVLINNGAIIESGDSPIPGPPPAVSPLPESTPTEPPTTTLPWTEIFPWRASKEVQGPDTNQNGVRDDVEKEIRKRHPTVTAAKLSALMQDARATQLALVAGDTLDPDAIDEAAHRIRRSVSCLSDRLRHDSYDAGSFITYTTVNTPARSEAYIRFNEAMSGTVSGAPVGDPCDE
ncbi:hypothetical protein [Thioalkalivibrio sp. HK1]|uniref:hypothetical protein n=1 Tax=Thioalkalivibrio sp. HK1 TaxID=1469245 RepID=UPI0012DF8A41|nr:hypothetical protein [Thioalkalivibrio sp. HK1]